ncbi:MAG: serine/threonine protein kinase [Bryobacterales bacterium]|nr:serine/threonine protein kinase [Bryobacterales bacterium]
MTPERWKEAEGYVYAAWELPEGSRAAFVRQECGHDVELLREVLTLVQARQEADAWNAPPEQARPERRFGPYRLQKMIGRGGMGAVYLADRADGEFEQKVAIKVVGLPFEIGPLRERFRQERQILADLSHPNISHLIDGGVTEDGELYLALEYIDGTPLDEYVRGRKLTEAERLGLFRQIAGAVAYAHQHLVVHRDLKPSNILVTADGVVKLLDFGTAKLLKKEGRGQQTATGDAFLTVAYASPEQLRGKTATTLSDVFALGAILHELITGEKAFAEGLEARFGETPAARRTIPGDLGLIVGKALESEPERRYGSVQELLADVEAYAHGRPVTARAVTWGYRAAKFASRNRWAVGASALVLVAVVAGAVMTLWQAWKAQRRFEELRGFARFVVSDLHTGLQQLPGSTALQRTSVERSLEYLDRLAAEAGSDDALRLEVADGYRRLGDVLGNPYRANLGDRKRAEIVYRKGLAMARAVGRSAEARRVVAELEIQLAGTGAFAGEKDSGLAEIRRGAEELDRLSAGAPRDVALRLAAARGWEVLGTRLVAGGGSIEGVRSQEAETAHRRSMALAEGVLAAQSSNVGALLQLARSEYGLGSLTGSTRPADSLDHLRRSLGWLDRLPEGPDRLGVRRMRAGLLANVGWAEGQAGMHAEAVKHVQESSELLRALLAADPGNTNLVYGLTVDHRSLGIVEAYRKHHAESVQHFRAAVELHEQLLQKDPASKVYQFLRAELLVRMGNGLVALGREAEAVKTAREGLAQMRGLASLPKAAMSHVLGACRWLAETEVVALRDGVDAARYCRKAVAETNGRELDAYSGLSKALSVSGDRAGAIREMEKAIALLEPARKGEPLSQQRRALENELLRLREATKGLNFRPNLSRSRFIY